MLYRDYMMLLMLPCSYSLLTPSKLKPEPVPWLCGSQCLEVEGSPRQSAIEHQQPGTSWRRVSSIDGGFI